MRTEIHWSFEMFPKMFAINQVFLSLSKEEYQNLCPQIPAGKLFQNSLVFVFVWLVFVLSLFLFLIFFFLRQLYDWNRTSIVSASIFEFSPSGSDFFFFFFFLLLHLRNHFTLRQILLSCFFKELSEILFYYLTEMTTEYSALFCLIMCILGR